MASGTPYSVDHTFIDGLNADLPLTGVPNTVLIDGRNMHLLDTGADGDQMILQNDHGNQYVAGLPVGWAVMNANEAVHNGIAYFALAQLDAEGNATGRGQLGSFPSPEPHASGDRLLPSPNEGVLLPRYRALHNFQPFLNNVPSNPALYPFEADEFLFSLEHPVQIEVQADYDGTVNLILNDGHNAPRIINTRFSAIAGGRYKVIDRDGERDTNLYTMTSFADSARLFQRSDSLVKAEFLRLLDGGQVAAGTWTYYFAYVNQDRQPTDVVAWTPAIPVFDGSSMLEITGTTGLTNRRVQLGLSGLDNAYQFIRVYAVHTGGLGSAEAVTAYQIQPDQRLASTGGAFLFTHTGYEQKDEYSRELLSLRTGDVETFQSMTQVDNMLAFAGPKQAVYNEASLRQFAQGVTLGHADRLLATVGIQNDGVTMGAGISAPANTFNFDAVDGDGRQGGYLNPWNCAYRLGYPTGESLTFGFVYKLRGGGLSAVFPVRGHDHLLSEQAYTKLATDLDSRGWSATGENTDGIYRFPQVSASNAPESIQNNRFVSVMGVSFKLPDIPAELRDQTVGGFFVRAARNADRLCQGYAVTVMNSLIQGPGNAGFDHQDSAFNGMFALTNQARRDNNLKCLPAIAGIIETAVKKWDKTENQGRIIGAYPFEFPYKLYGTRNILNNWRVAFYSPDTAANPAKYQTTLARNLRMSQQGEVLGRAVELGWNNYNNQGGSFAVWKTVGLTKRHNVGQPRMGGSWREASGEGANQDSFGSFETRLVGKHDNDDRYLTHCRWDAYLGLVGDAYFDGELQRISNSSTGFGGVSTGREIASYVRNALAAPRPIAWLVNLYPQHSQDETVAAATQGARPRDVLRDIYPVDNLSYFPISSVMSWNELEAGLTFDRKYVCFGGDTYKTMSYRRITSNVQTDASWLEPKFTDGPICTVLAMVAESESNPHAGRVPEKSVRPGEGSVRSYWTAEVKAANGDINTVRSNNFKQPETVGYNAGYSHSSGYQQFLALPRNVPFRAQAFPNDIAVTATHIAGGFQNGYRRYLPGSSQTYNRELGSITGLRAVGRALVVGFERGIAVVAVNERTQAGGDTAGSVFLEVRQVLSPYSSVKSREVGLLSPLALAATDTYCYGMDYAGAWRLAPGGALELLSALYVDSLLLPKLQQLGTHRGSHLLNHQVSVSVDRGRGDVIFSVLQNEFAVLQASYGGPADPLALTPLVIQPVPGPSVYRQRPFGMPAWRWPESTCAQLVYSTRLNKWVLPTSYRAQHHFSLQRRFYSVPAPALGRAARPGVFVHEGNFGYYYDQLHEAYLDLVVRGSGTDVQHLLDNLMVVSNGMVPLRIEYQPEHMDVTPQAVVVAAKGNISTRNAEYREGELWVTVPTNVRNKRQRAKAIRVRVVFLTREKVLITMIRAWLKDSFA